MQDSIERFYQDIGNIIFSMSGNSDGKIVLYAEVEDGVVAASVFYTIGADTVRYRSPSAELGEALYSFWEYWAKRPDNKEWAALSYIIDNSKFNINLIYPDQMDFNLDFAERRMLAVKRYFGDAKIDYSRPR